MFVSTTTLPPFIRENGLKTKRGLMLEITKGDGEDLGGMFCDIINFWLKRRFFVGAT